MVESLGLLVPSSVELAARVKGSSLVAALAADVVYLQSLRPNPALEDLPVLLFLFAPSCNFYCKKRY